MATEESIRELRLLANVILDWVRGQLTDVDKYWACVGDPDETDREVIAIVRKVRETLLDNEAYDNRFTKLSRALALQTKHPQEEVEALLNESLNQFVLGACRRPGPQVSLGDTRKRTIQWSISFNEEAFARQVQVLGKALSLEFLDQAVLARVDCIGFRFGKDFVLDERLSYDSGTNKFILEFGKEHSLAKIAITAFDDFRPLSVLCKTLYGFDLGLGEPYLSLPYSKGGEIRRLPPLTSIATRRAPLTCDSSSLVEVWKKWPNNLKEADPSRTLSSKVAFMPQADRVAETLLDLMTCYEIILAGGPGEINFRLPIRASSILSHLGVNMTFTTIEQAYDDRSRIIHGSVLPEELDINRLQAANKSLCEWLRPLTLLRVLRGGRTESFTKDVDLLARESIDPLGLSTKERAKLSDLKESIRLVAKVKTENTKHASGRR